MKKALAFSLVVIALTAGAAAAQMMGGGMMGGYPAPPQQQQAPPPQGFGAYPNMMGPGMMGGGYPNMMGYGYPNMMGPGMMGYGTLPCATYPGAAGCPGALGAAAQKKFLDETAEPRKKVHVLMFEYMELARDPKADQAKMEGIAKQIQELQQKIGDKWQNAAK